MAVCCWFCCITGLCCSNVATAVCIPLVGIVVTPAIGFGSIRRSFVGGRLLAVSGRCMPGRPGVTGTRIGWESAELKLRLSSRLGREVPGSPGSRHCSSSLSLSLSSPNPVVN